MSVYCEICGRGFSGSMARANLGRHTQACKEDQFELAAKMFKVGKKYRVHAKMEGHDYKMVGVVVRTDFTTAWPIYMRDRRNRDRFFKVDEIVSYREVK